MKIGKVLEVKVKGKSGKLLVATVEGENGKEYIGTFDKKINGLIGKNIKYTTKEDQYGVKFESFEETDEQPQTGNNSNENGNGKSNGYGRSAKENVFISAVGLTKSMVEAGIIKTADEARNEFYKTYVFMIRLGKEIMATTRKNESSNKL